MSKGGAPSSAERKTCHASRDAFFACLDTNSNDGSKCFREKKTFDEKCPKTWVKYFCRRRDYTRYADRLGSEGFVPTDEDK